MNILISVGKRIQSVREKRGLTQSQLEERTNINTKYISAISLLIKSSSILHSIPIAPCPIAGRLISGERISGEHRVWFEMCQAIL